jgi:hypothetical protein
MNYETSQQVQRKVPRLDSAGNVSLISRGRSSELEPDRKDSPFERVTAEGLIKTNV